LLKRKAKGRPMSPILLLVGVGWMYVVMMMSIAEATSPVGSVLGALFTLVLYGVGPLALVLYLLATPARRRRRKALEASAAQPDGGGHAAAGALAPEREEA
jgi:predicted membrane channel-forming protein YqfA (hemolysin III family)